MHRRPDRDVFAQVLLEEYRVLYGLLHFRMLALDRRIPVAGATFTIGVST